MRPASKAAAMAMLATTACAGATQVPPQVQQAVEARYHGKVMELRQSCYFGDLYEDNRRWLLTPYRAEQVHHIVDMKGRPIHPPSQRGIVPAGTRFLVRTIEFPTAFAMAGRMLTTPRYNPWVVLEPRDPELSDEDVRPWVLLLPRDLTTAEQVEEALSALLAPQGSMEPWLAARRPTVRVAIEHKDLLTGMSAEEMVAARGEPLATLHDQHQSQRVNVAWYGDREAWLVDERVLKVQRARPLPSPAAP